MVDQTAPVVSHDTPGDMVLNTAQMRDAVHVQKFRMRSQTLDGEHIITASAAREVRAQRVARDASESTSAGKAPASGPQHHLSQPRRLVALQESSRSRGFLG